MLVLLQSLDFFRSVKTANDGGASWSQGADSPLSGLVAMLVAADVIAMANVSDTYAKHVVWAPVVGDVWGYMGSKRMVWEMMNNASTSMAGLSVDLIQQVGVLAWIRAVHYGRVHAALLCSYMVSDSVLVLCVRSANR